MHLRPLALALAVTLSPLAACSAFEDTDSSDSAIEELTPSNVVLQVGADVPPRVRERWKELLTSRVPRLRVAPPTEVVRADADTLVLAIGETASTRTLIRGDERKPEGVIVRQGRIGDAHLVAGDGGAKPEAHANLGAVYAGYEMLERFGFAFLHPLAPTLPTRAAFPKALAEQNVTPRWPTRGLQIHTVHPLELTDLLEGWGPNGPDDAAGWEAMLPEWNRFLEWSLANRLNRVQWVLLQASSWAAFAESTTRQARLARLVDDAHAWGIDVGIDAAVSQHQQHQFGLIREIGDEAKEIEQLQKRVDWIMDAGFDYFSTEGGLTEFTHSDPRHMLRWYDELTKRVEDKHHRHVFAKFHASTGQIAEGFTNPQTGEPLNVNFLAAFADKRLGVMAHTVQHYGIDDPALTYGNKSFRPMYDFMGFIAGTRNVLWYPETAYWVSFDIDVPLFLPVYAERRVSDLRKIARDEDAGRFGGATQQLGKKIDGQMIFSSGWEWGYWLNDVVTARAAYSPETGAASDVDAMKRILAKALPFGAATKEAVDAIGTLATEEKDLMILGKVDGAPSPRKLDMRNGQAYLQGVETFDEIAAWANLLDLEGISMTQPRRLSITDSWLTGMLVKGEPSYEKEVAPLLASMERRFGARATELAALRDRIPASSRDLFDDLADAAKMTALRAKQQHALYDVTHGDTRARLADARGALDEAARVVKAREPRYRVPASRIAAWRQNPTSYEFTYLWTVHSLHYWWRDEGKVTTKPKSPCYANIIDPVDVGYGEDASESLRATLDKISARVNIDPIRQCVEAPRTEPTGMFAGLRD
jgi:hypothetical protein